MTDESIGRSTRREALYSGPTALALMALNACRSGASQAASGTDRNAPADVIFTGGAILTMAATPRVEALAVRLGRISAVGSRKDVMAQKGAGTRVVDLGERALLPGFIDPHVHAIGGAATANWVNVGIFSGITTTDGVLAKVREATARARPGEWIRAKGFDPSLQTGKSALTIDDLDLIAPNNPVFIENASGHFGYVNSKALEAAGITAKTPDPPHGRYQRGAGGAPNGVLEEITAFDAFIKVMPKQTASEFSQAVREIIDRAASAGCTALNDAGIGLISGVTDLTVLRGVMRQNPPVRMTGYLISTLLDEWLKAGLTPDSGDDRLRLISIKFWCDGSNQGGSGYLRKPYLNSKSRGTPNYTPQQLTEGMQRAHDLGWQIGVHANGDAAIDMTLAAYETILKKSPRADHRHRIEHCSLAHPDQIARMKALGVSPTFLIGHVYYWGRAFRDRILGAERAANIDPAANVERAGLRWTMHSDYDVTPIEPLRYVETAVTRVMRDGGEVLGPDQRVPIEAALKAVTLQAAWQCRRDDIAGSLETGKYADLVILERDPTQGDPATIGKIKVLETWLEGVRRFSA